MTLFDVLILAALAAAIWRGLAMGAVVQLFSFAGLWLGLVAGAAAAPIAARWTDDATVRAFVVLGCFAAGPLLFGPLTTTMGSRIAARLRGARLGPVDSAAGAVVAGVATLLVGWLVASTLARAPVRSVAEAAQRSLVARTLDGVLPPAPGIFARIDRLIAQNGLPQVFAEFEPAPAGRQPLPDAATVKLAAGRASASVLKISSRACGGILSGSGFVAARGLVMTNAHVVAGVDQPFVLDGGRRRPATTVVFDSAVDVAVLRVDGLSPPALPLLAGTVGPGAGGAVIGYPGGGPLDVEPAAVLARFEALGRDIYSRRIIARQVYQLRSRIRPGNSGGPLVDATGAVIGLVFSRSSFRPDIGFALTAPQVSEHLRRAQSAALPVDTGACAAS
ncbi:MAG TPA: MarP family serine protease [Acidimicrobiia bacterium]|nr:MarP family serine protease [Acidimicrobiia bacterium]